jgi:hypothetical protein
MLRAQLIAAGILGRARLLRRHQRVETRLIVHFHPQIEIDRGGGIHRSQVIGQRQQALAAGRHRIRRGCDDQGCGNQQRRTNPS